MNYYAMIDLVMLHYYLADMFEYIFWNNLSYMSYGYIII